MLKIYRMTVEYYGTLERACDNITHVFSEANKAERPFAGPVFDANGVPYFVPLSSKETITSFMKKDNPMDANAADIIFVYNRRQGCDFAKECIKPDIENGLSDWDIKNKYNMSTTYKDINGTIRDWRDAIQHCINTNFTSAWGFPQAYENHSLLYCNAVPIPMSQVQEVSQNDIQRDYQLKQEYDWICAHERDISTKLTRCQENKWLETLDGKFSTNLISQRCADDTATLAFYYNYRIRNFPKELENFSESNRLRIAREYSDVVLKLWMLKEIIDEVDSNKMESNIKCITQAVDAFNKENDDNLIEYDVKNDFGKKFLFLHLKDSADLVTVIPERMAVAKNVAIYDIELAAQCYDAIVRDVFGKGLTETLTSTVAPPMTMRTADLFGKNDMWSLEMAYEYFRDEYRGHTKRTPIENFLLAVQNSEERTCRGFPYIYGLSEKVEDVGTKYMFFASGGQPIMSVKKGATDSEILQQINDLHQTIKQAKITGDPSEPIRHDGFHWK